MSRNVGASSGALACLWMLAAASWSGAAGPPESPQTPERDRAAGAAREILTRLDQKLERVATMRGRFVQTFSSSGLGIPQSEEGRFALRRPDLTRWDYTSPERKIAVSDGVHTWLYMPEDRIVYRGTVAAWKRGGAFSVLAGGRLADGFEAVGVTAEEVSRRGHVLLEIRPRSPRDDFQELLIEIEPESLSIAAITAVDGMGNRIGIAFSDLEENAPLPADLFRFAPPQGVRVVEQDPEPGAP